MHVDGGHRQKPIDFQRCHFQNGCLAAILDFLVSGLLLYIGFEYQLQTSAAQYLCIWVWAYWFSATSISKWPPGGHIRFFGFWTLNFSLALNINCKLKWHNTVGTLYNTNVGVQKIPDRAIWKPVVAKRNNTNPWSCSKPRILVTRDSPQVHMAEQPASRHRLGVNFSLHAFITDCLTTL